MRGRFAKLGRVSLIVVTFIAWFSISNHCAIGALIAAHQQPMMSMHCSSHPSAPAQKGSDEPCCKILRATLASPAKVIDGAAGNFVPLPAWSGGASVSENRLSERAWFALDTGPPLLSVSFAESVLQRSLLAHAPPFLA